MNSRPWALSRPSAPQRAAGSSSVTVTSSVSGHWRLTRAVATQGSPATCSWMARRSAARKPLPIALRSTASSWSAETRSNSPLITTRSTGRFRTQRPAVTSPPTNSTTPSTLEMATQGMGGSLIRGSSRRLRLPRPKSFMPPLPADAGLASQLVSRIRHTRSSKPVPAAAAAIGTRLWLVMPGTVLISRISGPAWGETMMSTRPQPLAPTASKAARAISCKLPLLVRAAGRRGRGSGCRR